MKHIREQISIAALIAASIVTPAAFVSAIVFLVSENNTTSGIVFFGVFTALLLAIYRWSRRQQHRPLTVHEFVAHLKMHPELLPPGESEFDLERFRMLHSGSSQTGLDGWMKQFRAANKAAQPSSQFR